MLKKYRLARYEAILGGLLLSSLILFTTLISYRGIYHMWHGSTAVLCIYHMPYIMSDVIKMLCSYYVWYPVCSVSLCVKPVIDNSIDG